jgi:UDP-N-acetylmuramoylalanine--D-glutamate ligase
MKKKTVLIIGFGKSGRSAGKLYLDLGKKVYAVDSKAPVLRQTLEAQELLQKGVELFEDSEKIDFTNIEQVLLSPGVSPSHPLVLEAKKREIEVIGEIELGFRHLKNPAIGITGTNGKTTVTLLTAHILNSCGKKANALGNVGTPLTSFKGSKEEILVTELSSFQLETMKTKCLDAAVILNITPDHLDRYRSIEEYAQAKLRIKEVLKPSGKLYIGKKLSSKYFRKNKQEVFDDTTLLRDHPVLEPLLRGKKLNVNRQNALASYWLCKAFGVSDEKFMKALQTFQAPPHRLEFLGETRGISFYNDSKATNIESVLHAVKTLKGPLILIAGGVDKGAPYTPWKKPFQKKVKRIYAIGLAAKKIKEQLESNFEVILADSLYDASQKAYKNADAKDQILLSPGCASFDSFRNYEHRGDEFRRFVHEIIYATKENPPCQKEIRS